MRGSRRRRSLARSDVNEFCGIYNGDPDVRARGGVVALPTVFRRIRGKKTAASRLRRNNRKPGLAPATLCQ